LQFLAKYYEGDKIKKYEQRRIGGSVGRREVVTGF